MSLPEKLKPELFADDPDALAKALDLELIAQRAAREKMRARYRTWRALSFLFLLLVLIGVLMAYFYFSTQIGNRRGDSPPGESIENSR